MHTHLPLLKEADQVLVVTRPQGQVVDEQQHAQRVLVGLQASGSGRGREGSVGRCGRLRARGRGDHTGGSCGRLPQNELAELQCCARAATLLQEAHLLVEGQVEAPRSKTVPGESEWQQPQSHTAWRPRPALSPPSVSWHFPCGLSTMTVGECSCVCREGDALLVVCSYVASRVEKQASPLAETDLFVVYCLSSQGTESTSPPSLRLNAPCSLRSCKQHCCWIRQVGRLQPSWWTSVFIDDHHPAGACRG